MPRNAADDVLVRVEIAAPLSVVYGFFSDPEKLQRWLGAGSAIDLAPQGPVRIAYPNGDVAKGSVERAGPDRIVFTWGYENAANGMPPGSTTVDIELTPSEESTIVTLRHAGLTTPEQRRSHLMGWRFYMGVLAGAASDATMRDVAERAVDDYVSAWTETDARKRRSVLERVWRSDAIFKDSMGYVDGLEALDSYIGSAQRFMPGVNLVRNGPVSHSHGHVVFGWQLVGADGQGFGGGFNVGELTATGQFRSMIGFQRNQPFP
jgi:uncharacterized protein YndB with AHSA1/START domain